MRYQTLDHSYVDRAGVTAGRWSSHPDASPCRFQATPDELHFNFDLASKGGGRTDIRLTIGKKDLLAIMTAVAREMPSADVVLAEALTEAVRRKKERLRVLDHDLLDIQETAQTLAEWTGAVHVDGLEEAEGIGAVSEVAEMAEVALENLRYTRTVIESLRAADDEDSESS